MSFCSLIKGDYPEHSHVVFCPNKLRSFEPFVCLDLVLERQHSFFFRFKKKKKKVEQNPFSFLYSRPQYFVILPLRQTNILPKGKRQVIMYRENTRIGLTP